MYHCGGRKAETFWRCPNDSLWQITELYLSNKVKDRNDGKASAVESFKYFLHLNSFSLFIRFLTFSSDFALLWSFGYDVPQGDHNIIALPVLWSWCWENEEESCWEMLRNSSKPHRFLWSKESSVIVHSDLSHKTALEVLSLFFIWLKALWEDTASTRHLLQLTPSQDNCPYLREV